MALTWKHLNRNGSLLGAIATLVSAMLLMPVMPGQQLGRDDHKQLKWKGAGGCVVEFVHTPCRTVRYHEHSFGSGLGFDRISTSETIEATNQEGSESKTTAGKWRRWWQFPGTGTSFKITELWLRPERREVLIDHENSIYEAQQGGNRKWHSWEEDDPVCSHTATHYAYLSDRLPDSNIASFPSVGYRGRDDRGVDYEIYFAPSIGCQQMSFKMLMRNFFGFVTAEYERVVDSYIVGPPDASLFVVPAGYRQVPTRLPF